MAIVLENLLVHYNGIYNISETEHDNTTSSWYDLSGAGNNGAIKNGSFWGDDHLIFDGSSTWVNTGIHSFTNEASMEIMFLTPNPTVKNKALMSCTETGGMNFYIQNGKIEAQVYLGSAYSNLYAPINANEITYMTLTIKDNIATLYKNGILIDQVIASGKWKYNSKICTAIGAEPNSGTTVAGNYFKGKVYSARIYDRQLTETEVYQNFETDKETFSIVNLDSMGNVSKIRIGKEQLYDIKDNYSRVNRLSKIENDTAFGVINFTKGIQINDATIEYDQYNNTMIFT